MREENFEVKNKIVEAILKDLGAELKRRMPAGMGFALLMFDYGADGSLFYIADAEREDMIKTMEEFIERNKKSE